MLWLQSGSHMDILEILATDKKIFMQTGAEDYYFKVGC